MQESDLVAVLKTRLAMDMVATLSKEEKEVLIASAIARQLDAKLQVGYEITRLLEKECMAMVAEYIKLPEVETRLRAAAMEAAEQVMAGIIRVLSKSMEQGIKSKYGSFTESQE